MRLFRCLLFLLIAAGLLAAGPPHLSVLDYYRRLPPGALPQYRAARPTVADAANGYLLVQPSPRDALRYAEVAVWKRPDGTDLIGANYQTPSGGPGCGDDTCEPTLRFYTYALADPHETDQQLLDGTPSRNWHEVTGQVFFTTPPAVAAAVARQLRAAGLPPAFGAARHPAWVLHLPRRGTSIRVALYTGSLATDDGRPGTRYAVPPALRNKDVTLCYLRWQQGKFVAALTP